MAEATQAAVSFNPDDASGLLDNARVKVTDVKVDYFTSTKGKNAGTKYVNVDVTFEGGGQKIIEHYMLGGADQWAPNAAKNGAIPVVEGGKIWNKSDVFKLMKSFVDAGFPKAELGADLSVLVGCDVHVNRVTQEGATYLDDKGKERQRTTLLVTKLYERGKGAAKGAATKPAAGTKASAPAAGPTTNEHDDYATELLVEILSENGNTFERAGLDKPAFLKITRAKKAAIRQAVQSRLIDEAFIAGLVEQGLVAYDGKIVSLNA
jgi:hypothetical protein